MTTMTETSHFPISDCDKRHREKTTYLSSFNKEKFDEIHDQPWAKENMNKFHKSMQMKIHLCTICHEAWPIKFNPQKPDNYVCNRCSKDKNDTKKFSYGNKMIPYDVPPELQVLTQLEEMLISRALPIMRVYIKPGGQRRYAGHCINLPQRFEELANALPRYPKEVSVIVVKMHGKDNTFKDNL